MPMRSEAGQAVSVYYSCSPTKADQEMLKQLDRMLAPLRRQGQMATWYAEQTRIGQPSERTSLSHLNHAQIIVLLISPAYFETVHCYTQMHLALQRSAIPGVHLIPVLLRPTPGWTDSPLGQLSVLPAGERPISNWVHRDVALASVADEIRRRAVELLEQPSSPGSTGGVLCVEPPSYLHRTILQRQALTGAIYENLTRPDISTVVLTGLKGIGKSKLAAQVYAYAEARRLAGAGPFSGEALWLKVEANGTLSDLTHIVAQTLGTSHHRPGTRSFQRQIPDFSDSHIHYALELFNLLKHADAPRLIVLDQFEAWLSTEPDGAQAKQQAVSEWLDLLNEHACSSRLLLTAHSYPATGMHHRLYMQEYSLGGFDDAEGLALLHLWGVAGSEKDLRRAVKRCGGHVLALELLEQLRLRYRVSLATLLDSPAYNHLWNKDVKRNLFDDIYTHLLNDQNLHSLLRAFSLYREAVPWQAVYAILHAQKQITEEQALIALVTLQEYRLLQHQHASEARYALHPLVADFVRDYYDVQADSDGIVDEHEGHSEAARYYQRSAASAKKGQRPVEELHACIEATWHLCQARHWQEAYSYIVQENLYGKLHLRGENTTVLELYTLLLPLERWQPEVQQQARLFSELGEVYNELGDKGAAQEAFERALELYRTIEVWDGEVRALNNLGLIARAEGEIERALSYYQEALRAGEKIPEHVEHGVTLNNLGRALQSQGQNAATIAVGNKYYRKALNHYQQALTIYKAAGDTTETAKTLNNMGEVYDQLSQEERATTYYQRSLHLFREIGERRGEGIVYNNLGLFYARRAKVSDGFEYYVQSLRIFRAIADRWQEGIVLRNIGHLALQARRNEIALACFLLAKALFEALHYPEHGVINADIQAHLAVDQPFEATAAEIAGRAEQIVEEAMEGDL